MGGGGILIAVSPYYMSNFMRGIMHKLLKQFLYFKMTLDTKWNMCP